MQTFYVLLATLLLPVTSYAQNAKLRAYTTVVHNQSLISSGQAEPGFRGNVDTLLSKVGNQNDWGEITIPVVFNVLRTATGKSFSLEEITDQLDRLNEDFSGLAVVPEEDNRQRGMPVNMPLQTDSKIRFCFARLGQLTSAVNYRVVDTSIVRGIVQITSPVLGLPAVLPANHLNIWILPMEDGQAGYAQFPGGPQSYDGIVIAKDYFGLKSDTSDPFAEGRTLTHLVGNYLGLLPIWGKVRCGDDGIRDTPTHNAPNIGSPGSGHYSTCPGNPLEMTMNFMDSANDNQLYSFTRGQIRFMRAVLNERGPRGGILSGFFECSLNDVASDESQIEHTPKNLLNHSNVSVFPNPAINDVTVTVRQRTANLVSVKVFDSNGRSIYNSGALSGSSQVKIDTDSYTPGIYIISARLNTGAVITRFLSVH